MNRVRIIRGISNIQACILVVPPNAIITLKKHDMGSVSLESMFTIMLLSLSGAPLTVIFLGIN